MKPPSRCVKFFLAIAVTAVESLLPLPSAQAQSLEPAQQEIIDVTATGTVTSVTQGDVPFDASVQVGTPISFEFTIDSATAIPAYGIFNTSYLDDSGSGSLIVGDYSVTAPTSNNADVGVAGSIPSSGDTAGSTFYAGYDLESFYPSNNGFANGAGSLNLISTTTPAVAPSTDLGSIGQYPLADFDLSKTLELEEFPTDGNRSTLYADVTSYTVTISEVPEPSTWTLMLGGLGLLAWRSRSRRTVS